MPTRKQAAVTGDFSVKEILFIHHFCSNGGNGQDAAIAAGYAPKAAKCQASRMLANDRIKAEVDRVMGKAMAKLEITVERVLNEVARLGFADIRKCFNVDGTLKPLHELDDDTAAALVGMEVIEIEDNGSVRVVAKKFKFADKKGSLELLGKHLKMWTDKIEVSDRPMVYVKDMTGRKNKAEAAD
jgi:phage terminase small subunit